MIVYGLVAYLGLVALTVGYFVVKRSGDAQEQSGELYNDLAEEIRNKEIEKVTIST